MDFKERIKNINYKNFKNKPIIIVFFGFLFSFFLYVFSPEPKKIPTKPQIPNAIVKDIYFTKKPIPVVGTGPVYPKTKINITTQVSGKIIKMHESMVTGGVFAKGSVLITIDPRPYEAALNQALSQESALNAELKFVEKQLVRDNKLSKSGTASEMKRQETESRRDKLKAQIESAKALSASRKLDLEYTEIIAPFNGRVLREQIDEGAVVQKGANVAEIYAEEFFEIVVALSFPAISWYSSKNVYFVPSTRSVAGDIDCISGTTEVAVDKVGTFIVYVPGSTTMVELKVITRASSVVPVTELT